MNSQSLLFGFVIFNLILLLLMINYASPIIYLYLEKQTDVLYLSNFKIVLQIRFCQNSSTFGVNLCNQIFHWCKYFDIYKVCDNDDYIDYGNYGDIDEGKENLPNA